MDLTEIRDGIPFPIAMRGCTLPDIEHNTKVVTRELFKRLNLEREE